MIAAQVVTEVRRLLAAGGTSHRKIARLTGISRGTVGAIASGRRPDYELLSAPDAELDEPAGPPQRCAGCGGMVYMPCRLCRTRNTTAAKHRAGIGDPAEPMRLALKPEHRMRYDQVREWRRHGAVEQSPQQHVTVHGS